MLIHVGIINGIKRSIAVDLINVVVLLSPLLHKCSLSANKAVCVRLRDMKMSVSESAGSIRKAPRFIPMLETVRRYLDWLSFYKS